MINKKYKFIGINNPDKIIFRTMLILIILIYNSLSITSIIAQDRHSHQKDSTETDKIEFAKLDSLKPVVLDIIIEGNKTTDDEIILREMQLRKGRIFNSEQFKEDKEKIFNLGLFTRVDMTPILWSHSNEIVLKIKIQEKWYIYPMPAAGFMDGELRKLWVGMNLRWQNFRGRNERVSLNFGVGSNSFIKASYSIPWIGDNMHLFTTISGGYSIDQNRSLLALGRENGQPFYYYRLNNFSYRNYNLNLTIGKYFTNNFNVYTDIGYSIMRVSDYATGRTQSPDGMDNYAILGVGFNYDTRNSREYTLRGYYINANYKHYGLLREVDNFGRFTIDQHSFIPINIKHDYNITISSRVFTTITEGSSIPYYNHMIMGYGSDYVRGWYRFGFEGDNEFTLNNDIRIPIIQPDYLKTNKIPVIKDLKYINNLSYRYGLYFKVFYDIGSIWNQFNDYRNIRMLNGTGIGFDALLPFGMSGRAEYAFRLGTPVVGQMVLGFGVKF